MNSTTPAERPSRIVGFYQGTSRDAAGRCIEEIWTWDEERLEGGHDFIQWLFPLATTSSFNRSPPVLTRADIAAFRRTPVLRERLLRSLLAMLDFYGLELTATPATEPVVRKSPAFARRKMEWLTPGDHNHLRLTRIMTSTAELGLEDEAKALQRCLLGLAEEYPDSASKETREFWRNAISAGP